MKNLAPLASAFSGVFLLGLMSASSASAAQVSWSSTAGTTAWTTGTNWVGGIIPADSYATDIAVFNQSVYTNQPALGASRSISGLIFGDGSTVTASTTITQSAGALKIGGNGIVKNANSGTAAIVGGMRINGPQSWTNNSGTALTIGTSGATSSVGTDTGIGASTLTLDGSGSGQTTINNIISNVNGAVSIKINRTGTGAVTFTNANTYSGGTNVAAGTLLVNNTSGSGLGNGAISVNGGVLGGTGIIAGANSAISLNSGSISPGSGGYGTLTGTSLTWTGGAGMSFDLGATQSVSDLLTLTGAFNKGGGSGFAFNFTDLGVTPSFTYTLVNFGSSTGFSAGDFIANGLSGTFGLTANSLTFTTASIPEPSTAAALAAGVALASAAVRRRRRG